jgi:hypothetical protein
MSHQQSCFAFEKSPITAHDQNEASILLDISACEEIKVSYYDMLKLEISKVSASML